jgi:hypothetical protein
LKDKYGNYDIAHDTEADHHDHDGEAGVHMKEYALKCALSRLGN